MGFSDKRHPCSKIRAILMVAALALALGFQAPAGAKTYSNNTACSEGIYLRRLSNPPTNKWYMVTPLDLSRDGLVTLDLIAGNCMVIGRVEVSLQAGSLTATARYLEGVTVHEELLMFYTDLSDIQTLEHGHLDTPYRLGQPLALSAFGNPSRIWLYTNSRVSFNDDLPGLMTFASQSPRRINARIELARAAGLGAEDYLERMPVSRPSQPSDTTGIPDENGCIGGVCPVPTLDPAQELPSLPLAP